MPYIKPETRAFLEPALEHFFDGVIITTLSPGELNYILTRIVLACWGNGRNYGKITGITGVLKNVSDEFYRRVAVPYEDAKCKQNGDVYPEVPK